MMDMPCNCPMCGEVVELNDMQTVASWHDSPLNMVCDECYYELEEAVNDD